MERFSDTCNDAYLHFARKVNLQKGGEQGAPLGRIVVLGSGWGAHSLMKVVDMTRIESLTIISVCVYFHVCCVLLSTFRIPLANLS